MEILSKLGTYRGWQSGSSGKAPAYQVQPQFCRKQNKTKTAKLGK
jgi:hypothetical protein